MGHVAGSGEKGVPEQSQHLADVLTTHAPPGLRWHYEPMPEETHATIYHPAALKAFRAVFKPGDGGKR